MTKVIPLLRADRHEFFAGAEEEDAVREGGRGHAGFAEFVRSDDREFFRDGDDEYFSQLAGEEQILPRRKRVTR